MATIVIKNNNQPNSLPQPANLEVGELALNTSDEKLFFKNSSSEIVALEPFDINKVIELSMASSIIFS